MNLQTVADWEWAGLGSLYDFTAAYPSRELLMQLYDLDSLDEIFRTSIQTSQQELEEDFLNLFFTLGKQNSVTDEIGRYRENITFHYSASMALEAAANVLRLKNVTSIMVICPTLGSLVGIIKRHIPEVFAFSEELLSSIHELFEFVENHHIDAIFFVSPNNPTGSSISKNDFELLVKFSKSHNIILVIDACFRFFSDNKWDQYEILSNYSVDFIIVEDTGKTWSVAGIKLGLAISSLGLQEHLHMVTDQFLLNVSPVHIVILNSILRKEIVTGLKTVSIARKNYSVLAHELGSTSLKLQSTESSIAWIQMPDRWDEVNFCQKLLKENNVATLPGYLFNWDGKKKSNHLRVALIRGEETFFEGTKILREFTNSYEKRL